MFKELKLIKLIIIVGLLATILFKIDFLRLSVYHLYTNKLSYNLNEKLIVYASSKAKYPIFNKTSIFSIEGKAIKDIALNLQHSVNKEEEVLLNGDIINNGVELQLDGTSFQPGIYLIAKDYPIIISRDNNCDVTVVYPHMNNLIYQKVEEQSVFSYNLHKTNLKRTAKVDEYTLGLASTFKQIKALYKTNYINDIEIEDYSKIENSKVLVIYGKSSFWTPKMKENLSLYIKNGGSVIFISSYLINNVCWYDKSTKTVALYDKNRSKRIESWHGYNGDAPRYFIGTSYLFGGKSSHKDYVFEDEKHPIFDGITSLSLSANLYNSPPVTWNENIPNIDTSVVKFYSAKILAFNKSEMTNGEIGIKSISEFQPDSTSGKIINFGAEEWCTKIDSSRDKLILNTINYLVK